MDLLEEITIGDVADIFVIPANIEKTFDLISHILDAGAFPVIIGGDHSIGYPDTKALAKHVDGRLGIIHFDRHIDTAVTTMDERTHAHHALVARDGPAQCAGVESGADRHRRLDRRPFRRPSG